MSEHYSDEEQLATLKRFWDEYGKSLVAGVVIAMVSVFGYKAWQKSQVETAQQAAALYQQVLDIMVYDSEEALTEEQLATLDHVVSTLKQEYDDTPYAGYAALFSARQSVEAGDLNAAKDMLQWAIDQKESRDIEVVARIRLSRILLASEGGSEGENAAAALKVLDGIKKPGGYQASVDAARGDVLLALGRNDEARTAYQGALDEARINGEQRPVIQMKLDNLAPVADMTVKVSSDNSSEEERSGGENINDESAEAKQE